MIELLMWSPAFVAFYFYGRYLEKRSKKKYGVDFGPYYWVELVEIASKAKQQKNNRNY